MLLSNQKLVELSLSLEMEIAEVDSFRVFLSGFNALVIFGQNGHCSLAYVAQRLGSLLFYGDFHSN